MGKRIWSVMMSVVLMVTMLFSTGNYGIVQVKAAEKPNTMKMPVVIYDHLNDNLLFEYVLGTKLSLYDDTDTSGNAGKGLVETELGEDGTPVYKKETVIQVAKDLKDYLETQNPNNSTDLYARLRGQIVEEGKTDNILGNTLGLEERGWDFGDFTYKSENGSDYWYDGDTLVWKREGDWLKAQVAGASGTFNFGTLKAGTYTFTPYQGLTTNVNMKIITESETYSFDNSCTFTLAKDESVSLTVEATTETGALVNPSLSQNGENIERYTNITMPRSLPFTELGWVVPDGSTWKVSGYGGITCDTDETTETYLEYDVEPGRKYQTANIFNENEAYNLKIRRSDNDEIIAENLAINDTFTIPAGVNKVKIALSSNKAEREDSTNDWRFGTLDINMLPYCVLSSNGDDLDQAYEASKAKFARVEGQKVATSYDIENCMDYVYYVLNTFWTDTNGDITKKTDAYKSIQLDLNNGQYTMDNNNLVYDIDNKNIYKDADAPTGEGFFPIDDTILGANTDLSAPFGETTEGHNFHFAMKAHCEFVYTEAENLSFNFEGDDDVYLFINGKLALDIGGAHGRLAGIVNLNDSDVKAALGLEEGEVYTFDFFYLERHTTASNISIATNMILEQASATPSITYKDQNGNILENGTAVNVGDEVKIEYAVQAGIDGMSNVAFEDKNLGVTIGKDGISLGEKGAYVDDKLVVTVYDKNGNPTGTTYELSKDDLNDSAKVAEFVENLDSISLDKGEKITVSGISIDVKKDSVIKSELQVELTYPAKVYDENTGNLVTKAETVDVLPVELLIVPTLTPSASVDVTFKDVLGNNVTGTVNEDAPVNIVYTIEAGTDDMRNVNLTDSKIGFSISSDGIVLGDDVTVTDSIYVTVLDKNGAEKAVYSISKDKLSDTASDEYKNFVNVLGANGISINSGEKIVISGISKIMTADGITATPELTINGAVPVYDEENETLRTTYEQAQANDSDSVSATPKYGYTVKYVDENGKELATTKTGEDTSLNTVVREEAIEIDGYSPQKDSDSVTITEDETNNVITFVYTANKYGYTVKYVDENGDEIYTAKTGEETAFGTEVIESPIDVEGYTKPAADGKVTITSTEEDNVITFTYTANKYGYTVKYVDEDGEEIAPAKTGEDSAFNSTVTEDAIEIDGYSPQKESDSVKITTDETNNVITFVYTTNKYGYTVKYVDENGDEIAPAKTGAETAFGTEVTESPIDVEGYTKPAADGKVTITSTEEDNVITFTYTANKYGYTVKYVDEDGEEIAPAKTGEDSAFNSTVTEDTIEIDGYSPQKESDSVKITTDENNNVITFVYDKEKYPYTVKYVDENGNSIFEEKTGPNTAFGTKVIENPIEVEGYTKPEGTGTVTIGSDKTKNVITFTYTTNKYGYTVKYVDENGDELANVKVGEETAFGTEVTETPVDVDGYSPKKDSDTITIGTDENVITFVYEKNNYSYTIKYVDEDGKTIKEEVIVKDIPFGTGVTETPSDIEGYTKPEEDGTVTVGSDPDKNIITFVYKANEYSYTVKYVDENGVELATTKTGNAKFNSEIVENAVAISGYSPKMDSQNITINLENNEITFVYVKGEEPAQEPTAAAPEPTTVAPTTKAPEAPTKATKKTTTKKTTKKNTEETTKKSSGNVKGENDENSSKRGATVSGTDNGSADGSSNGANTGTSTANGTSPRTGIVNNVLVLMIALFAASIVGIGISLFGLKKENE